MADATLTSYQLEQRRLERLWILVLEQLDTQLTRNTESVLLGNPSPVRKYRFCVLVRKFADEHAILGLALIFELEKGNAFCCRGGHNIIVPQWLKASRQRDQDGGHPFTESNDLVEFSSNLCSYVSSTTPPLFAPSGHPHYVVPELLIHHQALEGWIYRQHVLTRTAIAKELAPLRAELVALRKEIRAAGRSQRPLRSQAKPKA